MPEKVACNLGMQIDGCLLILKQGVWPPAGLSESRGGIIA